MMGWEDKVQAIGTIILAGCCIVSVVLVTIVCAVSVFRWAW